MDAILYGILNLIPGSTLTITPEKHWYFWTIALIDAINEKYSLWCLRMAASNTTLTSLWVDDGNWVFVFIPVFTVCVPSWVNLTGQNDKTKEFRSFTWYQLESCTCGNRNYLVEGLKTSERLNFRQFDCQSTLTLTNVTLTAMCMWHVLLWTLQCLVVCGQNYWSQHFDTRGCQKFLRSFDCYSWMTWTWGLQYGRFGSAQPCIGSVLCTYTWYWMIAVTHWLSLSERCRWQCQWLSDTMNMIIHRWVTDSSRLFEWCILQIEPC